MNHNASVMSPDEMVANLDVPPFVRIIWNSPEAMEQWGPIVERARRVHDELEYAMVKEKERKCATLHISPSNYDRMMERIQKDKLVWLPMVRTKNYSGFSHYHMPVKDLDMNCSVYGVLARTIRDAEAFRAASSGRRTDHKRIGELLGFPECCSQSFVDWWPTYYDPVFQAAEDDNHESIDDGGGKAILVEDMHIATHQMLRYAGFRLTSHFPHSLTCQASIEVGRRWYELGKYVDPQGLAALMKILKLDGKWSVLHGIATVVVEPFTIVTNSMPTKHRWSVYWKNVRGYDEEDGQS